MKRWFVLMLVSGFVFAISGCGGNKVESPLLVKAENPQLTKFDQELGEIEDSATAEKAVNTFVDYVDSRIDKKSHGPSAQSVRAFMGGDLIKQIAKEELLARQGQAVMVYSEEGEEEFIKPPIDAGAVTDNINDLAREEGIWISDKTVDTARAVVEGSLPNLNPEKSEELTPLGAMVLGYAIASQDDGSTEPGSVGLSTDKVGTYVENITQ